MLSNMQSKVGLRVCWSALNLAQSEDEREAAMREFERIWASDIKDWRNRLLAYAKEQGNPEIMSFLGSYLA